MFCDIFYVILFLENNVLSCYHTITNPYSSISIITRRKINSCLFGTQVSYRLVGSGKDQKLTPADSTFYQGNQTILHMIFIKSKAYESRLSYDIAVIRWITSCDKTRMNTGVISFGHVHVTSVTTSASAMHFLTEITFIWRAVKCHFYRS